jgi:16S rRNA C967 or C1407 C5-methylase (RsmB/RsmF family)
MSRPYTPKPETLRRLVLKQALRLRPGDTHWQEAFTNAVLSGQADQPALFWLRDEQHPFAVEHLTSWQPNWVEALVAPFSQIGKHPLYASGAYYPLDFSSLASVSTLLTITEPLHSVLDLCSAPGGKGLFAWRALRPERLVCNEVIGKRAGALISNLTRCHAIGSSVTRLDPAQIAVAAKEAFDLVLVDAPCTGQSLIARGTPAAGAFQPNVIATNMTRQRRILANAAAAVAPGGYLSYMTCTYSREENEKNVEWLLRRFPKFSAVEVPHLLPQRSWLAEFPCYRISPQDGLGAGGFTALLRSSDTGLAKSDRLRPSWEYSQLAS